MGVFQKDPGETGKLTAITGLSLFVDANIIALIDNELTHIPALPTTGNLEQFYCNVNLVTSITNFPNSLTAIGVNTNPGLATIPAIPPLVTFLSLSLTALPAVEVASVCSQLVTHGLNNGFLELVGLDESLALADIATLIVRGWTVTV